MKTKTKHLASITAGIISLAGYAFAASLGSEKYTYDASGNIVEKFVDGQITKISHDNSNRVTYINCEEKGCEKIIYDADSRPVSYQDASGHPIRDLTYGYENKVLATKSADKTAFFYNSEGHLIAKSAKSVVTSYAWDGLALAAQDTVCFTNENHITGGIPLIVGSLSIMISDYLGTTLLVDGGPVSSTAFGEGLTEGRFTSKIFIAELKSYLFPCRLYFAATARWMTEDPTGFPDGANNHAYVRNDPTGNVDPLGTVTWSHFGPYDQALWGGKINSGLPTVLANQVDAKGTSGNCHIRKITTPMTYSASSAIHVTSATHYEIRTQPQQHVLSSSAAFRQGVLDHELEHKKLKIAMAAKTYGEYEAWSAQYVATENFKSEAEALSAFNKDVSNAQSATISKYNVNLTNDVAPGHPTGWGGGPGQQNGTRVINNITYPDFPMVVNNPQWGAPAMAAINSIVITHSAKTTGNCEK